MCLCGGSCFLAVAAAKPRLGRSLSLPCRHQHRRGNSKLKLDSELFSKFTPATPLILRLQI
jgi:hypothetical protein